jgi:hypothetical protein
VSNYTDVHDAVTEYIRDYIASLKRRNHSYHQIAERLGCSHVWVIHLDQPTKYGRRRAGADIEHKVAELLHGGSVDALRRAALSLTGGATVVNEDESGPFELRRRDSSIPVAPTEPVVVDFVKPVGTGSKGSRPPSPKRRKARKPA